MNKTTNTYEEEDSDLISKLINQPLKGRSIEYVDNRLSIYRAQQGKCAITGEVFAETAEMHCHHIKPRQQGGTDEYDNLILVTSTVHKLIHATKAETISKLLETCKPDIKKLNELRQQAGNKEIGK